MTTALLRPAAALVLATSFVLAGCGDDEPAAPGTTTTTTTTTTTLPPLEIPAGCNPIAYQNDCLLPYPSDFFLVEDASMPSGRRVELTDAAMPRTKTDAPFDFLQHHPVDGFSHHMPIMAVFPEGVDASKLTFHTGDPAPAIQPDSVTLLVDADTGELVPHWAELDRMTDVPASQALFVRPYVKLQNGHRYIVAFQGLDDAQGQPIQPPQGFDRILGEQAAGDPSLSALATHYEEAIFPVLTGLGVERSGLQLAWDFTVGTEEWLTRDTLAIRDDALALMAATPPAVTVTNVIMNPSTEIAIRVEGTLRVPLYLDGDQPGARIFRGPDGLPAMNGEAEVPFLVQVPVSAVPADANFVAARTMQYGHGLFGLREEINYGFMRGFSLEQSYITAAVDWWGMSEDDIGVVTSAILGDVSKMFTFTDRLPQAVVNMMALSFALKDGITQIPELQAFGRPMFDPDQLYYYGISQGAIFGVTLLALSPTLDRAAISVGGGPYSLMMSRSASYADLFNLLSSQVDDPLTAQKVVALSQHTWDRVDPMTYAGHLLANPYPDTPPERHLLMQIGIGDHSVNNLASHLMARALGIPLLDPTPRPIYGLESAPMPADDGLVVVDFQLATEPGIESRIPTEAEKNDVHENVRRNARIKQQLDSFFRPDGTIQNFCDGACDPE